MMDVAGRRLEDAVDLLISQGYEKISVVLTASPRLRDKGFGPDSRVIRQRVTDNGIVELLVCNIES